jgi:3D-(3,5/4)-trihydroxycyclohexane-1,2-dione acylhydrolase (decyclizing)
VLQQLEDPRAFDVSVNDAFRPVSKFFDRINRPEQLPSSFLAAMRVLTDQADTGAVTLALPQDVQAEAYDWPEALFEPRVWPIARPVPEAAALAHAIAVMRSATRPLIVAGGGVIYSEATGALIALADATGIPVAETQAGKGSLPYDHPLALGAVGATGTTAANAMAAQADVVVGVGTRWSDFTTASRTAFAAEGVRFVNINVAAFDAFKHSGVAVVGDAREALTALRGGLAGYDTGAVYRAEVRQRAARWDETVEHFYRLGHQPLPAQSEVIGAVNETSAPTDVVVGAAGSMPGDLHKLWRTRDPKGYHVEYGYSCMGYEIAGGLGIKMAAPDREVVVMVGDGSYLMMAQELVTSIAEHVKLIVVLVQNHGYASIGRLSESLGSQRFGTAYRYRGDDGRISGDWLPVDLAANAASLGATVVKAASVAELKAALREARRATSTVVIHVEADAYVDAPDSESWWDVPVAEVAAVESTQQARKGYEQAKQARRDYL